MIRYVLQMRCIICFLFINNFRLILFIIFSMDNEDHPFLKSLQQEYTCPISKLPIRDPVTTIDGHTYERQAIAQWLKTQVKSPKTGLDLQSTQLIPNHMFKSLVHKINSQLPTYLSQEGQNKIQIEHLREQIKDLKDQLNFQRKRYEELMDMSQKQTKIKKIEKGIYQSKRNQLREMRQQKHKYQKLSHEFKSKQQQFKRQIQSLKQQAQNFEARYTLAASEKKKLQLQIDEIRDNRIQILRKLKFSFGSNFKFIGHLLKAIDETTKYQNTLKEENSQTALSLQMIEQNSQQIVEHIATEQKNINEGIMSRLQEKIRQIVNKVQKDQDQQRKVHLEERRRLLQRIRRQNGMINPLVNQQNQQNNQQGADAIQNSIGQNSTLYEQLQSIRWLMSKRNYSQIPQFYTMDFFKSPQKDTLFLYGVKLNIHESNIPFEQYFNYSWNHVRCLNLMGCTIGNQVWNKFIENANRFQNLVSINIVDNNLTSIKKADLQKFTKLKKIILLRNDLDQQSQGQLKKYIQEHPKIKVIYPMRREGVLHINYQDGDFLF